MYTSILLADMFSHIGDYREPAPCRFANKLCRNFSGPNSAILTVFQTLSKKPETKKVTKQSCWYIYPLLQAKRMFGSFDFWINEKFWPNFDFFGPKFGDFEGILTHCNFLKISSPKQKILISKVVGICTHYCHLKGFLDMLTYVLVNNSGRV